MRDFVRENLARRGLVVDVAIHRPDRGGDPRNVHAHLLIVERQLGPRGFAAVKDRSLSRKATLYGWRSNWAKLCNRYLAAAGHAARVDHRTLKAQGVRRQPTKPLGPAATAMQRRGLVTPRGQQLRRTQARNALRQGWRDDAGALSGPARGQRAMSAKAPGSAAQGLGFRAAASGLTLAPMPPCAVLRAPAPAAPAPAAGEVCRRSAAMMDAIDALAAVDQAGGDELGGLLDAIATEVHGRASFACARITADFAARIAAARKERPRDQVATAVMALQQERREAVKAVREAAARDVQGQQAQARVMLRRARVRPVAGWRKLLDYEPKS